MLEAPSQKSCRYFRFCWGFVLLLLLPSKVWSAPRAEEAASRYQKGEFAAAADIYLQLIDENPSNASLYHNLGASLYRNGEIGAAVAAYLKALQLKPRDPDFKFNLAFLLAKATDKLEARMPPRSWQNLLISEQLSQRELLYLSVGSVLLLSFGGTWLLRRRETLPRLLTFLVPLSVLCLYLAGNLWAKVEWQQDWGAVQANELAAYSSPTGKSAVQIFKLHEGAPFAVLESSGDWLKIGLSDQKTGWIQRDQVVVFGSSLRLYHRAVKTSPPENAKASLP